MSVSTVLRRPRRAQAERSASTQAQLLDAAAHLVHTRSFAAATLFEVAKAAGVTPGALQHHFGSKAELMIRLLEHSLAGSLDDAAPMLPATALLRQRAQALVESLWLATYATPRFLVAWGIYFGSVGDAEAIARVAGIRERLRADLHRRFVQALPELGEASAAAPFIDLVLSSLRGLAVGRVFEPEAASSQAQRAALVDMIVRHCGGPDAASAVAERASARAASIEEAGPGECAALPSLAPSSRRST